MMNLEFLRPRQPASALTFLTNFDSFGSGRRDCFGRLLSRLCPRMKKGNPWNRWSPGVFI